MKRWADRWLQVCRQPTWWCVAVLFLVLTVPLSLSSKTDFDYVRDETPYSIRSVRQISENWPFLNVQEQSLSPSAPGYYWFLAGVSKIIGYDVLALRMVNLSISLMGLMILFEWLHRRVAALDAALLIAPLAASNFYVKCAAWVYPENPATILAMLTVLLTLD